MNIDQLIAEKRALQKRVFYLSKTSRSRQMSIIGKFISQLRKHRTKATGLNDSKSSEELTQSEGMETDRKSSFDPWSATEFLAELKSSAEINFTRKRFNFSARFKKMCSFIRERMGPTNYEYLRDLLFYLPADGTISEVEARNIIICNDFSESTSGVPLNDAVRNIADYYKFHGYQGALIGSEDQVNVRLYDEYCFSQVTIF
jgi:hypothetical protein